MEKLQNTREQRKQAKKYIRLGIAAAIVLLLAVMPILAAGQEAADGPVASILTAAVEVRDIDTTLIGGGLLASEEAQQVRIPENIKLTEYLVANGDTVSEGDPIAKVDRVSVMTAIAAVQETLDDLSREIADASSDTTDETVKALAGGTVKIVYAKAGEAVQDVMLEHGALAVLSLDDIMAVQFECSTELEVGDGVTVAFSDAAQANGRIKAKQENMLTVTLVDAGYSVGESVTVSKENGEYLGSGELYILSPWNATAYSGVVTKLHAEEGDTVSAGKALFSLENTGKTAEFQRLIDKRQAYEELMQTLFTLYRTETVPAPCSGIVTGVDNNGIYLLSDDSGKGLLVTLLSRFNERTPAGFAAYAATVTAVSDNGLQLLTNPNLLHIADLFALSSAPADISSMTEVWNYSADTALYTQNADGLLQKTGNAKVGDVLLVVGDAEQARWLVLANGHSAPSHTTTEQNELNSTSIVLLSGTDSSVDTCTGGKDCTASSHNDGCLSQQTNTPAAVQIVTTSLNPGIVGRDYRSPLQATDGKNVLSGTWTAIGLPHGLQIDAGTGVISGVPTAAGSSKVVIGFTCNDLSTTKEFTLTVTEDASASASYFGYVAQVKEIADGIMKVRQIEQPYTIADLDNLPAVSVDPTLLTQEATYISMLIKPSEIAADDYLWIIVDEEGVLKFVAVPSSMPDGGQGGKPDGGFGGIGGGIGGGFSGGGGGMSFSGMPAGGMGQEQASDFYSLEELSIAAVTSQERMTVSVTIDELDITKIHVGQRAILSVDALGGEQFEAQVTQIANSGENEGGNSKFTVELALTKSGDMLPGMYASAYITVATAESIPSVPVAALDQIGADAVLYTARDEETGELCDPVTVTTGRSDGEYVEILDGISLGQTLYYAYYDTYVETDDPQRGGFSFNMMRRSRGRGRGF